MTWELVGDYVDRREVPGGWIYRDKDTEPYSLVFVPAPPRLVAFKGDVHTQYVNPERVCGISTYYGKADMALILFGDGDDGGIAVGLPPAEVAAALGLEVWNDAPFACAGVFHPDGAESSTCAVCGEDREAHDSVDPGERT